jgi:hypothetical protein
MKFFNKMGKAKKKWRRKAWLVNPSRTKIILVATASPKLRHVPPWMYNKELDPSVKELFSVSKVRKEYCGPLGFPSIQATGMPCDAKDQESLLF